VSRLLFLIFFSLLFLSGRHSHSQNIIEWQPDIVLKLSDFKSPQTSIDSTINSFSVFSGSQLEFAYQMTNGEYIFTKNFNSKVSTNFHRSTALIIAPDTNTANNLVSVSQYHFDLTELYARKFRKEIFEQKKAFSNPSFFQSIYDRLNNELIMEYQRVVNQSDFGRKGELLKTEHNKVLSKIQEFPDFCKTCKPQKKSKKK